MKILRKNRRTFFKLLVGRLLVSIIVAFIVFLVLFLLSKTPYPVLTALLFLWSWKYDPLFRVLGASYFDFNFNFCPYKIGYLIFAIVLSQALDGFIIGPKIVGDKMGSKKFLGCSCYFIVRKIGGDCRNVFRSSHFLYY